MAILVITSATTSITISGNSIDDESDSYLLSATGEMYAEWYISDHSSLMDSPMRGSRAPTYAKFWVNDGSWSQIDATLKTTGTHCYVYVDNTSSYAKWNMIKNAFDNDIYDTEVNEFGNPPNIDSDDRIYILISELGSGTGGYFHPIDQDPGNSHSNAKDMIYLDEDGSDVYMRNATAHEFNHLIHYAQDAQHDEELWVLEGTAMYAEFFVYGSHHWTVTGGSSYPGFDGLSDISLTFTSYDSNFDNKVSQYGAAYLFALYLAEKYGGSSTIGAIMKDDANGITGINNHLPAGTDFEDVFETWTVANYVDNNADSNLYWYENINIQVDPFSTKTFSGSTESVQDTVHKFAADYIEVTSDVDWAMYTEFQGEELWLLLTWIYSDYIVKIILYNTSYPNGKVIDFVDNHKGAGFIENSKDYTKIIFVVACTNHVILGNGAYTLWLKDQPLLVDLVLDFDRSGSMSGSKIRDAKTAAKVFIDNLKPPISWWLWHFDLDKVGLVSFSSGASLDLHLSSNFQQAKNIINGYSASGMTNMGAALSRSINELKNNGRDYASLGIIYLTDGQTNTGMSKQQILNSLVPQAVEAGINIYTLGFGSNVDGSFLSNLAHAANGEYYFAPTGNDLKEIYLMLSHTVKGWQQSSSFTGTVLQDEVKTVGTLDVAPETTLMKVILSYPGSDLDLLLKDPHGDYAKVGSGVLYSGNSANPEYYEIYDPEPGIWTVEVYGKETPVQGEAFSVMSFVPTGLIKVRPSSWKIDWPVNETKEFIVEEIAGMSELTDVQFIPSDLTSRDESMERIWMEDNAERELNGESELPLIEPTDRFTIPASCFSFSPNGFTIPAGGAITVDGVFNLPSGTPCGTYTGYIDVLSSTSNGRILVTLNVVDAMPPTTIVTCCEPSYGINNEWVTSDTEFILSATDDTSGVSETNYRIWYDDQWTPWHSYDTSFRLNGEGLHYLQYFSVDNVGNAEDVHTQTHYVDDTPPETTLRVFYLKPEISIYPQDGFLKRVCLVTDDDAVGAYHMMHRTQTKAGWSEWSKGENPTILTLDSSVLAIEYYGHDLLDNAEEIHHKSLIPMFP